MKTTFKRLARDLDKTAVGLIQDNSTDNGMKLMEIAAFIRRQGFSDIRGTFKFPAVSDTH